MILDEILANTRRRLPELRDRHDDVFRQAMEAAPPPSFREAVAASGMTVIAEVKRRSPSRGDLDPDLDPAAQAARYAVGGAGAVSVLTEPDYFNGSPADLTAVALSTRLPVLRKDFIVEPVQIWEAKAMGAAAVLLIVAALDDELLAHLLQVTQHADLDPLVEVHTEEEAARAVEAGAEIVGVNNRDLHDFSVDLATSEKLAPLLADVPLTISESGIFGVDDARRVADAGYDAVLVGEALVKTDDPAGLVSELRSVR